MKYTIKIAMVPPPTADIPPIIESLGIITFELAKRAKENSKITIFCRGNKLFGGSENINGVGIVRISKLSRAIDTKILTRVNKLTNLILKRKTPYIFSNYYLKLLYPPLS